MQFGDRIILVEDSGKLEAGTPGWYQEWDEDLNLTGMAVKTRDSVWVNPAYVRAEQTTLFIYRHKSLFGCLLMPMPIWNLMRSAVNNLDGLVYTPWKAEYKSVKALMDEYQAQPVTWLDSLALVRNVLQGAGLRVGVQPLYETVLAAPESALPEQLVEALERYERWTTYFKEQVR